MVYIINQLSVTIVQGKLQSIISLSLRRVAFTPPDCARCWLPDKRSNSNQMSWGGSRGEGVQGLQTPTPTPQI